MVAAPKKRRKEHPKKREPRHHHPRSPLRIRRPRVLPIQPLSISSVHPPTPPLFFLFSHQLLNECYNVYPNWPKRCCVVGFAVPPRLPLSSIALSLSPSSSTHCRHCVLRLPAAVMMRRVAASLVPPWLEPLLTTPFFAACPSHSDAARSECNMYCLDCSSSASGGAAAAFCFYCRSDRHSDHKVIQIRRSSYHDVVRVAEIQKVLDTAGVQTYVINSARVLFLNKRPQPRASTKAAASPYTCEICARSLLDPFRFCSLGCKLVGIKRNGDASFVLKAGGEKDEEASVSGRAEDDIKRLADHRGGSREGPRHDTGLPAPSSSSSSFPTSRRRKGIPHRAPFGS